HLVRERESGALGRREKADLAVGIGEIALIGEQLVVEAENGIARQDLGERDRVAAMIGALVERGIVLDEPLRGLDVAVQPIRAAAVAEGQRRQVAEHVLADGEILGVGLVVGFFARDEAGAVGGLAVQIVRGDALLSPGLVIRARRELLVGGSGRGSWFGNVRRKRTVD